MTVTDRRERIEGLGLDLDNPTARLAVSVEQPEPFWEAVVTFEVGAAGTVPVAIKLQSTRGRPVTAEVWKLVKVGSVIKEAVEQVSWLAPLSRHPEQASPFETGPQQRRWRKGRPAIYSDAHYQRVGQIYMAAVEDNRPPVRAVAQVFADEDPQQWGRLTAGDDKRARAWVRAARARGYITDQKGQG
jgi:hypothetical protein